ncbi:MAG: IS200/IS605 family transposase [Chloroflexota bacterium]|jgi:putative transposase
MSAHYHCIFSTYRRRPVLLGEIKDAAEALVREIAVDKGYQLIAHAVMPDHVHLLLTLERGAVPRAMNMFKGIMSRRIFLQYPDLRFDMQSNHLWSTGYFARTVDSLSLATTIRYIFNQDHPQDDL